MSYSVLTLDLNNVIEGAKQITGSTLPLILTLLAVNISFAFVDQVGRFFRRDRPTTVDQPSGPRVYRPYRSFNDRMLDEQFDDLYGELAEANTPVLCQGCRAPLSARGCLYCGKEV